MKTSSHTLNFRTQITGKVFALSAMPLASAVLLFFFALDAARKFSPNDSARILFAGLPLILALMLVSVVAVTLHHFLNREVIIDDEFLVYKDSKTELHLDIKRMAFSPPGEKGVLKTLMFSDGETFVQLPEIFLGDRQFATLSAEIAKRRRKPRHAVGSETYSL